MPSSRSPVFVIDDDPALRDGLLTLLRSSGVRARGFASALDFLGNLPEDRFACVLTDLRMPEVQGSELVQQLRRLRGQAWPVIVITGYADVAVAVRLMQAGVVDLIEKPFAPDRLLESVLDCLSSLRRASVDMEAREAVLALYETLTRRERQVFEAVVQGKSSKEIAFDLEISPRTVDIFRANVMSKMKADNLSALVHMAFQIRDN